MMGGKGKTALRSALDQTTQYKVRAKIKIPFGKKGYTVYFLQVIILSNL